MSQHEADPTTEPVPQIQGISFGNTTYEAIPSGFVAIKGVNIKSPDFAAMVLYISEKGKLETGREYTFEVQQIEGGEVVGGSTYIIRIENDKPLINSTPFEEERENVMGFEYIPPWLMDFKKTW